MTPLALAVVVFSLAGNGTPASEAKEDLISHYSTADGRPASLGWNPSPQELQEATHVLREKQASDIEKAAASYALAINSHGKGHLLGLAHYSEAAGPGTDENNDGWSSLPGTLEVIFLRFRSVEAARLLCSYRLDGTPASMLADARLDCFEKYPETFAQGWALADKEAKKTTVAEFVSSTLGLGPNGGEPELNDRLQVWANSGDSKLRLLSIEILVHARDPRRKS